MGHVPVDDLCFWCDCTQCPAAGLAGRRWEAQDVQMQHTPYGHRVDRAFLQVLIRLAPLHSHGHGGKSNQLRDLHNNQRNDKTGTRSTACTA